MERRTKFVKGTSATGGTVTFQAKRELVALFVSGALLCFIIFLFALIFVIYQGHWYHQVNGRKVIVEPLEKFHGFATAINAEVSVRAQNADATAAMAATDAALDRFRPIIQDVPMYYNEFEMSFTDFRASGATLGPLLMSAVDLAVSAGSCMETVIQESLSSRANAAMNVIHLLSSQSAYGSLMSRMMFVNNAVDAGSSLPTVEAAGFAIEYAAANIADRIILGAYDVLPSVLTMAEDIVNHAIGYAMPTTNISVPSPGLSGLTAMMSFLEKSVYLGKLPTHGVLPPLVMFIIGSVLCFVAVVVALLICCMYGRTTAQTRGMLAAFESVEVHQELRQRYLPLLLSLRGVQLPRQPQSELEREYLVAAQHVELLRSTLPQLLLGDSIGVENTRRTSSKRIIGARRRHALLKSGTDDDEDEEEVVMEEDGGRTWLLATEAARLELASSTCSNTVLMEIGLPYNHAGTDFTPTRGDEKLQQQLQLLSAAYAIIVEEVNRAGGVVMGFRDGLCVPVVWNVTHAMSSRQVALVAVRTAWILRRRLAEHTSISRVLMTIVSGPAVLNNTQLGHNRYAILLGTMMAQMDRIRQLGRSINHASLLLDHETMLRLPRQTRHCCKPVVVLRSSAVSTSASTVVYSVDETSSMTREQSELYSAGFVLYQNNMVTEAVAEFERYLKLYPHDYTARWLAEFILKPKKFLVEQPDEA